MITELGLFFCRHFADKRERGRGREEREEKRKREREVKEEKKRGEYEKSEEWERSPICQLIPKHVLQCRNYFHLQSYFILLFHTLTDTQLQYISRSNFAL